MVIYHYKQKHASEWGKPTPSNSSLLVLHHFCFHKTWFDKKKPWSPVAVFLNSVFVTVWYIIQQPFTSSEGRLLVTLTCCSSPGVNSLAGRFSSWNARSSNFALLPLDSSPCACPLVLTADSSWWRNVVCFCPSTTIEWWLTGEEGDTHTEGEVPSMLMGLVWRDREEFPFVGVSEAASNTWSR